MSVAGKSLIGATILLLFIANGARAQDKMIRWWADPRTRELTATPTTQVFKQIDSVFIEAVNVEDASVIIGQPFTAGPDWLNHITFRVRNNSARRLKALQITLTLPQMHSYINIPYLIPGCVKEKPICVEPGELVELRMPTEALYEWVKKSVADHKLDLSTIDTAEVMIVLVTFEDGTSWMSRCAKTPDVWHPCPHS